MSYFVFQWPSMLWLLFLVIPAAWLLHHARRKRAELTARMGGGAVVPRVRRDALHLSALALMILALARPGYAPERRSVSQSGRDVVFAIDVSRSMLAQDAQPSRLEAAKQGVRDALEYFRTERAGLVIYAGSATILCPLTYDYDFVRYMLEQAAPRAVDFGGTTMLSAVEKSVDNVFSAERAGMQDLVVLTDGEDHGPEMTRVATLLKDGGVDLLVVGLGDATAETRIPIENEDGGVSYLEHDEDFVYTRLHEEALRELVGQLPGASYVAPGAAAFDLAASYARHVEGKPMAGSLDAETFVVYREAGLILIAGALVMLLGAMRFGRALGLAAMFGALGTGMPLEAAEGVLEAGFEKARGLQVAGQISEALEAYGELDAGLDRVRVSPAQLAAMQFNQGLCHLERAEAVSSDVPGEALAAARLAQRCFLEAKRMDQGLERAGRRLDDTAAMIATYQAQVDAREEEEEALQQQMNDLLARLEMLRDDQSALQGDVRTKDPKAKRGRPARRGAPRPPVQAPLTAGEDARAFVARQAPLLDEGRSIYGAMEVLDRALSGFGPEGGPPPLSVMQEPMRLMKLAIDAQQEAGKRLGDWTSWETARASQQVAVDRIQEILDLLAGDDSDDSEDDGSEDYEDDWDMEDYEDAEDGNPSSMMMEGDLAAGSEMQPLPVPNYSAEDLLMEEQGNTQFRQQERAKAQAGKVEKDW